MLELIELALFSILFAQVVFGALMALTGFWILRRGGDPLRISATLEEPARTDPLPVTAIVMPIYNEDVRRVFQGLRLIYESLARSGRLEDFHFFVLSDSNDPNHWIAEEKAWLLLCKEVNGFGRIFYRKRRVTLNQKSGNVADFCRRWGAHYRYMIVLDADSIVTGGMLTKMVRLMERNPRVGIIQTAPQQVLGRSLFSRIQQFASRVYGPIFSAGAGFWHLGESTYWGHNAIIRVQPFIEHCALPELPFVGGLGGRILSHDSVEAAFMRRAGYEVWFAYDLAGSYEEGPPDLIASLQRDMRWCQGNMQHLLVLTRRGLRAAHRAHLLIGILGYASAPLWLLFLILSLSGLWHRDVAPGQAISSGLLFGYVLIWLFLPKALGVLRTFGESEKQPAFQSRWLVLASALGEVVFSMLLAPIYMLAYTRFVFGAMAGWRTKWGHQNRGEERPGWGDAWHALWGQTAIGLAGIVLTAAFAPALLPWLTPVLAGWCVAVPFARLTSSTAAGERMRKAGLFVVPEEMQTPEELARIDEGFASPENPFFQQSPYVVHYGLLQAVLDPFINAIHVSLLRWRDMPQEVDRSHFDVLRKRLLREGPAGLKPEERATLLWDPDSMVQLHQELWICVTDELADWWRLALRNYNEAVATTTRRRLESSGVTA